MYMMSWQMKFNSSSIGVWFEMRIRGNVLLKKMANKGEEWIGTVI